MSKTAAIYARYSSSAQNDASIEQQVEECTRYAQDSGLTVVATYEDRAMTGRNDRRPGFQRMMRAADRREFQVLITYKSNRLARNMLDALRCENRLDAAGIKVVYCKENFGDNAAGRLALRMMMSLNEFYSDNLSEDVRRGMLDGAQKCKVVGALPFGYRKSDDGRAEIDPPAAEIVRETFSRILAGETYMDIARDFNARGLRTARGGEWNKGSFHGILHNERYTGVYMFENVRVEGGMPQIITREAYDRVQNLIKDRNAFSGRHRSNNDYLLTGKLFCGKCLSPMVGVSGRGRHGDVHYYYSCNGKRIGRICDKKNVRKEWIEEEVTRAILTVVLTDDMLNWIADTVMAMAEKQRETSKLGHYENRLAETQKQIDNIVRAVELGVIADEFKTRMAKLQSDKSALQSRIAAEKSTLLQVDRPRVLYYLETIRGGNPADPALQKRIIRDFIRAVYVYDDHFKLVADFTGAKTTYDIPATPLDSSDPTESPSESAPQGSYMREIAPPNLPYTNPCHHSTIEAVRQGFVIIWYSQK